VFPCYLVLLLSNLLVWTGLEGGVSFILYVDYFPNAAFFLGKLVVMRKGCWFYSLTGYDLFLPLVPSLVK